MAHLRPRYTPSLPLRKAYQDGLDADLEPAETGSSSWVEQHGGTYDGSRLYNQARAFHALVLRREGLTYREISPRLGPSRQTGGLMSVERTRQIVRNGERLESTYRRWISNAD